MKSAGVAFTLVAMLANASSASAHHSFAEWTKDVGTVTGTVTDYQWANPHVWIMVSVPGPDGNAVKWGFESASPLGLKQRGWRVSSIKPGDKITVTFHTNRHGGNTGNITKVVLPDNSILTTEDLIAHPPGAPPDAAPPPEGPSPTAAPK